MKKSYLKGLIILFILIMIGLLVRYSGINEYLTLTTLKGKTEYFAQVVKLNYLKAVFIFIVVYTAAISVTLPVVAPMAIIGGALFDVLPGTIYSLISVTVGSIVSFLLYRYVFGAVAKKRYSERITKFQDKIKQYGPSYLLTLHFLTIVPLFVINSFAALTDVHIWTFVWTAMVGSLPLLFVYAFAGGQMASIETVGDIFSPPIIVAMALLILLALAPMILKKFKSTVEV